MYFYKYLKADNLSISMLRNGEVFFASPKELNDAHECKPQFIFSADSEIWTRFIYDILSNVCLLLKLKPKSNLAYQILSFKDPLLLSILNNRKTKAIDYDTLLNKLKDSFGREAIENLVFIDARNAIRAFNAYLQNDLDSKLNNSYYMTSFSKSATNLTMWGHYGNAEKGFAIIYESQDGNVNIESSIERFPSHQKTKEGTILLGISKHSSAPLIKVDYKNKPVRANGFRGLIPKFFYSNEESDNDYSQDLLARIPEYDENNIGRVKFTDWKYEKELRLHLPVYEELDPPLRCVKIAPQHIKGVIFGSRTSDSDKRNILAACYLLKKNQKKETSLFVFQSRSIPSQYKINVTSIGKVCNIQYNGSPYLERINKQDVIAKEEVYKMTKEINAS